MTTGALPTYDELPGGSSWEVWKGSEVFGTLNLLTPARAAAAAQLVQTGETFPMNWNMELPGPPLFGRPAFQHEVTGSPRHRDDVLHDWNTQSSSQWDGLRHIIHPEHGDYGGVPDEHGMHHWARKGIVGRGVLADVARYRADQGRPIDPSASDAIDTDDLDGCLASQGVELEEGDILLIHTGWMRWYESLADDGREALAGGGLATPGLRPDKTTVAWLWNHHVAAVAGDNPALEVWPPVDYFMHVDIIPMLGIPIGEMFNLPALADACQAQNRFTFLFTSAPLNLLHGVASPPNALAIL